MDSKDTKREQLLRDIRRDMERDYFITSSFDYIPVIFRERNIAAALATAKEMEGILYIKNSATGDWEPIFIPFAKDSANNLLAARYGLDLEHSLQNCQGKRLDCMFPKVFQYYEKGSGIIYLPDHVMVARYSFPEGEPLPSCPLSEYEVYSERMLLDITEMVREMENESPLF